MATTRGKVVEFDEHRGVGVVESDDRTRYSFHCTAIADGTRAIEVGVDVEFDVVPGLLGRFEAATITPVQTSP